MLCEKGREAEAFALGARAVALGGLLHPHRQALGRGDGAQDTHERKEEEMNRRTTLGVMCGLAAWGMMYVGTALLVGWVPAAWGLGSITVFVLLVVTALENLIR